MSDELQSKANEEDNIVQFSKEEKEPHCSSCEEDTAPGKGAEEQGKDPVVELEAQLKEARERLLYQVAEFENFRKRQLKEREEMIRFANEGIIRDLLDALDGVDRGIKSIPDTKENKAVVDGMKMIMDMMMHALEKHGLKKVAASGEFNMELHEAVERRKVDGKKKNEILEVLQEGFQLNNRIIRSSKVIVAE